jgi:hypothetical protein
MPAVEAAKPIQAALFSTDLMESSLPDSYITGGSGKGYTDFRRPAKHSRGGL